jgi:hypothetical protein
MTNISTDFDIGSTLTTKFMITRIIDKTIISSKCELELTVNISMGSDRNHAIILKSIRYWLDQLVDQAVAYNVFESTTPIDFFDWVSNNVIMSPDEPNDWLLLILLCAKVNAIGQGCINVATARLKTNTAHGFGNTFTGNPLSLLPNNDDWVGNPAVHDQPWWNRSDGSTMDVRIQKDIDELPTKFYVDIHSQFENKDENESVAEIIRPKFKTIVSND